MMTGRSAAEPARRGLGRDDLLTIGGDLLDGPSTLWRDSVQTFTNETNLVALGVALGIALLNEAAFDEKQERYFEKHTILSDSVSDGLATLGNGFTLFGGTALWSLGALAFDEIEAYHDSKIMFRSLGLTSAATLLLKVASNDPRPGGSAYNFPSGHASLSMATASTLGELYGPGVGIPAYALSGLIGLQRLDDGKHDSKAVFFGFVLGWVVGHTLASEDRRVLGFEVQALAEPELDAVGITLSRSF